MRLISIAWPTRYKKSLDNPSEFAVTADDQFHIGSDTKAMTATLVALFVEKGDLGWDDTLGKAFPELAEKMSPQVRRITLTQLLTHRSGLPHDILWLDPLDIQRGRLAALRVPNAAPIVSLGVVLFSYLRLKLHLRAAANNGVTRVEDFGIGHGFDGHFFDAHVTDGFHAISFLVWNTSRRLEPGAMGRAGSMVRSAPVMTSRGPWDWPSVVGISPDSIRASRRRMSCRMAKLAPLLRKRASVLLVPGTG